MRLVTVDEHQWRWDAYRAFHVTQRLESGTIVQFDTGEVMVMAWLAKPGDRRCYEKRGFTIIGTNDENTPALYLPDRTTRVPMAWLNHYGQQILLVDNDTGRVVSTHRAPHSLRVPEYAAVPQRLQYLEGVYFPGPGQRPVAQAAIDVRQPVPYSPEESAHLRALRAACRAWVVMARQQSRAYDRDARTALGTRAEDGTGDPWAWQFATMDDGQRWRCAEYGVARRIVPRAEAYLLVGPMAP